KAVNLHSQRESHFAQDLFYLIERLAAEILGLEHLLLGSLDKLANMPDIGIFQTVCRPNGEFQFVNAAEEVFVEGRFRPDFFLLSLSFLFEINEDGELVLENLRCVGQRILRLKASVRPDLQGQLVIVGNLGDAGLGNRIAHLAHRRKDSVDGDRSDGLSFLDILISRNVTLTLPDGQLHSELGIFGQGADVLVWIEHLDHRPRLNVSGGDAAFSRLLDMNPAEISVPTHLEAHFLQIEYHIRNVFQDTGD